MFRAKVNEDKVRKLINALLSELSMICDKASTILLIAELPEVLDYLKNKIKDPGELLDDLKDFYIGSHY